MGLTSLADQDTFEPERILPGDEKMFLTEDDGTDGGDLSHGARGRNEELDNLLNNHGEFFSCLDENETTEERSARLKENQSFIFASSTTFIL